LISDIFKEEEGFRNEIITYKKKDIELHNLITKIGTGKEKIVLTGHFDTVPIGEPNQWKYDPFSAKIEEGKLFGRGSADMKGGITTLIGILKSLKENPEFLEKYTLVFLGTADEEAGMTGALTAFRKGVMKDVILLIVAEPTNMNIGIAEKGLLWANITITGKSAHSSMPYEGINSIEGALNLIPKLNKVLGVKTNEVLGKSTLNLSKIEGGTVINVVPEKTTLQVDYRLVPEQDKTKLIEDLKNIKISPCSLDIKITHTLPAIQTDVAHPFIQNLKQLNESEIIGLPYATDAAMLIKEKNPVPFVIFGPGNPELAHKVDECIDIEDIFKATRLLTKTLLQTYLE
jgi:succinyl-diaminopimelate desuccinylase